MPTADFGIDYMCTAAGRLKGCRTRCKVNVLLSFLVPVSAVAAAVICTSQLWKVYVEPAL